LIGVSSIAAIVFMLNNASARWQNLNIHLDCLILDGVYL
jgi:hypothetical protein